MQPRGKLENVTHEKDRNGDSTPEPAYCKVTIFYNELESYMPSQTHSCSNTPNKEAVTQKIFYCIRTHIEIADAIGCVMKSFPAESKERLWSQGRKWIREVNM